MLTARKSAISALDALATDEGFTILLGDLNTGPRTRYARGFFPELYAELERRGFRSAYPALQGVLCTRCDDNPLVSLGEAGGVVVDHVMLRNAPGAARAHRIWTSPVVLAGGKVSALSDHFGVRALVDVSP